MSSGQRAGRASLHGGTSPGGLAAIPGAAPLEGTAACSLPAMAPRQPEDVLLRVTFACLVPEPLCSLTLSGNVSTWDSPQWERPRCRLA